VNISTKFPSVNVGGPVQNLQATITNDTSNSGLTWTLQAGGVDCQQPPQGGCGTLTVDPAPSLTAHYQPPATPPSAANSSPTITAKSVKDPAKSDSFNFNIITPPISVTIQNKFQSAMTGGQAMTLNASITNDFLNQGLTWTITAGGVDCQQPPQGGCGTLTVDPSSSLIAHYQPPATPPSAANSSPTITAKSVGDTTKSDSFNFNIVTPLISVTIQNKFPSIFTGSPAVTVNATVTNDFLNQGVTWTLTNGGTPCTAACGTLTPIGSPSASATYTPPSPAAGPTPSPTITATAGSASDSFSFALVIPNSLVTGNYVFFLRGYDKSLQPMALAGSLTADGIGNITGGEYDLNDNTTVTSVAGPLSGTYSVDTNSFPNSPRVTFTITGSTSNTVLRCALSLDGKRGKVIELDGSLALSAGTLLHQDPSAITALSTSTSPKSFAFGLDSDAPINGRVVEAGQFILGAGATSVTGGIADESQAGAATPIFGGAAGAASITIASSSATAPDASGRGTLTLSINGSATQYAYYVSNSFVNAPANSLQLNLIEIDAGGALKTVQAGTARSQNALSANSINATSVAALTGMTSVGTPASPSPDVVIGVLTLSNAVGATQAATFDTNNAGTVTKSQTAMGSFSTPFDPTTGRSVIANAFFPVAVLYLYDTGSGFLIDATPSAAGVVNHGFSGPLMVQTVPNGGFTLQSLSGNLIGLGGGSSNSSQANLDFAANFDGAGNYSAELDFTVDSPSLGTNLQGTNFALNGNNCNCTYQMDPNANPNLGHGTFGVISSFFGNFPNQGDEVSFYLVGLNQFVAIEDLGLSPSGILFFDPQ
jgi:hypothetical protein